MWSIALKTFSRYLYERRSKRKIPLNGEDGEAYGGIYTAKTPSAFLPPVHHVGRISPRCASQQSLGQVLRH
jgi:hypothetical protein